MALNSTHPEYDRYRDDWQLMADAYEGEATVKSKGETYLPATASMHLDGMSSPLQKGFKAYQAYVKRAVFPDYVSDAVEHYIGMLHQKPATFELPPQMEPLLEKCTIDGEGLQSLLRRINEQQLVTGRMGLLVDLPEDPGPDDLPYIALYTATALRNWDDSDDFKGVNSLNFVCLDESGSERDHEFEWVEKERYRILLLMPPQVKEGETQDPSETAKYHQGLFSVTDGQDFDPSKMIIPMFRGVALEELPFVPVNSKDLLASPDNPPLIGLGRQCMTIYRGEADYRQQLHNQGQDTLVVIGGLRASPSGINDDQNGEELRVGAGARIDVDLQGDAKYIGVTSQGLPETRTALENDRKIADTKAGTMIAPSAGKQESGDALTTRLAAQTATLTQIAQTAAEAVQAALRVIATWMGQDPEKVKVQPNLEFAQRTFVAGDLVSMMTARTLGAPLSIASIHDYLVATGVTEKTLDEELEMIEKEDADLAVKPPPGSQAPGGPGDPNMLKDDPSQDD